MLDSEGAGDDTGSGHMCFMWESHVVRQGANIYSATNYKSARPALEFCKEKSFRVNLGNF